MTNARFILAFVLLLLAAYIVVMNWGCVLVSLRNKRRGIARHHSTVPLLSLVLAALAYLVYPRPDKMWLLFLPLCDIANWSLLLLPMVLMREVRAQKRQ
ncbi:MAG: hypothetical protein HGA96_05380 [Desulfobulbaceae bacterium]|nr:hypothetical protein [Desulfobulbaceae bacterium]